MAPTHTDSLDITVQLQPPFPSLLGFGNLLLLELASDNQTSQTAKVYTQNDLDAIESDWTTDIQDAAETWFSQEPSPDRVVIGEWDKAGGQTVKEALDAIQDANPNWFWIASTIRNGADQDDISAAVEDYLKPSLYMLCSSDDKIVTSNDLASLSDTDSELNTVIERDRTFINYHTSDTEYLGVAQAGIVAPYDPDDRSAPFYGNVNGVAEYGSLPDGANIGTAQNPGNARANNANVMLPFGSTNTWLAPGHNANGRQGRTMLTKYWFQDRLQAKVANEIQTEQARGKIIPIGAVGESLTQGQERMAKLVGQQYDIGASTQHFQPEQLDIDYPEIKQADLDGGIIPLEGQMTVTIGGQAVDFGIFFSREPVNG